MTTNQASSTDVVVTARAIMNILQDDQEQSLEDAFQTEMRNEMTTERAEAFLEDAAFEIEPVEKFKKDPAPKDKHSTSSSPLMELAHWARSPHPQGANAVSE